MKLHKLSLLALALLVSIGLITACGDKEPALPTTYESVDNDPLDVRIYTLENGLKVYMSYNPEEPKVQGSVVVRVGSKNDPAETTGLSHYLEHLMFKGTEKFGTSDYEKERPLLDEISDLYEVYRGQTDPDERAATYRKIDSVSQLASTYGIPNEYDKLMSAIGSTGTNAYTTNDETVYVEYFPSNQLESWAKVQGNRFSKLVMRGFHTELEAVYEEKNISLDNDASMVFEAIHEAVFAPHPYGTQTTIGTQEHLKNPSLVNIQKHFDTYYVPNNMAVCLSGDFDFDEALKIVNKYFGKLKPNENLPEPINIDVPEKQEPKVIELSGEQPANVFLGWLVPGAKTEENLLAEIVSSVLSNGSVGLIDANLNLPMKVLGAYAFNIGWADHDILMVAAYPTQGQTLEQVKDLLLEQVAKIRDGDFDEEMLKAIVTNDYYQFLRGSESNRNRAETMGDAFISGTPWEKVVQRNDRMMKVTKEQIVEFANKYLKETNYSVVYKRQGQKTNAVKVVKPPITPIKMNRDSVSDFVKEMQAYEPKPIEPKFVDFNKDIDQYEVREGVKVLQTENKVNDLFSVQYIFDYSTEHSRSIQTAVGLQEFLGDEEMTLSEFKTKLFALGCDYYLSVSSEGVQLSVYGLNQNMSEALALIEKHLKSLVVDPTTYKRFVDNVMQERENSKTTPRAIFSALEDYALYGPHNPTNSVLSDKELKPGGIDPKKLTQEIKSLFNYPHIVAVYSPEPKDKIIEILNEAHPAPENFMPTPEKKFAFVTQPIEKSNVFYAPCLTEQVLISFNACKGEKFNAELEPVRSLFNSYFGGSMNSIVFQEIREAKALAYNSYAGFIAPSDLKDSYRLYAYLGTQVDKLQEAVAAMREILEDMPRAEKSFEVAKDGALTKLRTERVAPRNYAYQYYRAMKKGLDYDIRKDIFEKMQNLSFDDMQKFYEERIQKNVYNYAVMGDPAEMDMKTLEQYGPVQKVTLKEIFGY